MGGGGEASTTMREVQQFRSRHLMWLSTFLCVVGMCLFNVLWAVHPSSFHGGNARAHARAVPVLKPRRAAVHGSSSDWESQFRIRSIVYASNSMVNPDFRQKLLVVSETLPQPNDGGGLRAREVLEVAATALDLQPWMLARTQWQSTELDGLFERLGVHIVANEGLRAIAQDQTDEAEELRQEFELLGEGFVAPTGTGKTVDDFPALARLMARDQRDNESSVQLALLAMWSYHTAPSGDPHWTIPELVLPQLRMHLPGTCAVIMSDDLQHRRFRLESGLTETQAERLAVREMAAYEAADGVFFVSREDRDEAETMLLLRRQRRPSSSAEMPLLLALPYVGKHEAATNRTQHGTKRGQLRQLEPLLLFVGSATRSNEQAVSWLVHKVLPILREARPNLELTLAGSRLRTYHVKGVRTVGFVDDLDALVAQASVLLLPSFIRSGVATKVLLGIRQQVPVITTGAGRRGIWHANDTLPPACQFESKPLIVHDDASEYAAATLALLGDDRAYRGIQRCLADFADSRRERQQRQAMLEMRDHCLARHAGTSGASSLTESSGQEHERKTRVALTGGDRINREARDVLSGEERLLVPVSGDIADDGMRLSKHAAWHGQTRRLRALDLTVLTSFVLKDTEFVLAWLEDISRQQALQIFVVELVIGCFEEEAHAFIVEAVNRNLGLLSHLARVSVCLFADDPGIYGIWDMIIGRAATAPIVTNWNVDDRKSPLSLSQRLNVLNSDAQIDAVTSGVLLFNDSRYAWAEREQAHTLRLFDLCGDRLLQIEDMFVIHWNRSDANTEPAPFVHGSQNVPHNSPMWRKAMHHWVGGFRPKDELGCYDFSFWVRALRRGVRIQHINEPLEMYLARSTSHGHRSHAWDSPAWADRWANECDSRQEWEANSAAVLRAVIGKYAGWGRCAANEQAVKRPPQVVGQLHSPTRKFTLFLQDSTTLCVEPSAQHLLAQPSRPLRLVIWRHGLFKDLLCMHRARDSRSALVQGAQAELHWCKWTCYGCTLQVSDAGHVFWSNGTFLHDLFRWSDNTSCWHASRPLWHPIASAAAARPRRIAVDARAPTLAFGDWAQSNSRLANAVVAAALFAILFTLRSKTASKCKAAVICAVGKRGQGNASGRLAG